MRGISMPFWLFQFMIKGLLFFVSLMEGSFYIGGEFRLMQVILCGLGGFSKIVRVELFLWMG